MVPLNWHLHSSRNDLLNANRDGKELFNNSTCDAVGKGWPRRARESRGYADCVQRLLKAGASAVAPLCFAVDTEDEPEWDEMRGEYTGGLAGWTALQLAAVL